MHLLKWTPNQIKQYCESKPECRRIKYEFVQANALDCFWLARQIFDRDDSSHFFLIVSDTIEARALLHAFFIIKNYTDLRTTMTAPASTVVVRRYDSGQRPPSIDQRFVHHDEPHQPESDAYKTDNLHGCKFFSPLHSMAKPGFRPPEPLSRLVRNLCRLLYPS